MKKITLLFSSLLFCIVILAQFSVAVVGGPQINSVSPGFSLFSDTTSKFSQTKHTGLNFGVVAHVPMNPKQTLFFRTGVLYSAKGSQLYQEFDTANRDLLTGVHYINGTSTLKVNYIDVPVNFLLKLPLNKKTKFVLGGGIQGSLFYNGSTDLTARRIFKVHPDSPAKTEFKQFINKDLPVGNKSDNHQSLHFSANGLTGFEFGRVFINVLYSHGLTEFFHSTDKSYKHGTLGFHLGIFLGNPQKENTVRDKDLDGVLDEDDYCPEIPGLVITNGCPDRDGDGISDREDKCPDIPGTFKNNGCPPDSDGDGIKDEEDKCPDVAGTQKYNGCPVPDTDLDGINDEEDTCPNQAGTRKYNGCPVPDSDKDGINDEEDKCPTVPGEKNNSGCPKITVEEQQKVTYAAKMIQFEFKKTDIAPSSFQQLDEVVTILKNNPTLKIRVEGHTSGPVKESNTILSQQRAESVKAYFVKKGIEAGRVLAQGFGSSRPISKNGNEAENPIDRRVELFIF